MAGQIFLKLFDPAILSIIGILAAICSSYLESTSYTSQSDLSWAEWSTWAIATGTCQWFFRYRAEERFTPLNQEFQTTTSSSHAHRGFVTTAVAVLLVAAQHVMIVVGRQNTEWAFPLVPLTLVLSKISLRQAVTEKSPWHEGFSGWQGGLWRQLSTIGLCVALSILLVDRQALATYASGTLSICFAMILASAYALLEVVLFHDIETVVIPAEVLGEMAAISTKAFITSTVFLALLSPARPSSLFGTLVAVALRSVQIGTVFGLCIKSGSIAASTLTIPGAAIGVTFVATLPMAKDLLILASAASIYLVTTTLPVATNRSIIFALFMIPVLGRLLLKTGSYSTYSTIAEEVDFGDSSVHPIIRLHDWNKQQFFAMVQRQSQTVPEAVAEYKRRWGRLPPQNFDRWFTIARENDFQLIDEFDTIMESLEPFWGVPASDLRARVDAVQEHSEAISAVELDERGLVKGKDGPYGWIFEQWINATRWGDIIPNTTFVLSSFDEPRVVAPYDVVDLAMRKAQATKFGHTWTVDEGEPIASKNIIKWTDIKGQSTWDAMLSSCHMDDPARTGLAPVTTSNSHLPFVNNITQNMDFCASDDNLHDHPIFIAPATMIITHKLVPIFSQCKPSLFNDVLYPSPYYAQEINKGDIYDEDEVPWDQKLSRLYWAGSTTGGVFTEENWKKLHRTRLTLMTKPGSQYPVELLDNVDGRWATRNTTYGEIANLFDMKITALPQCKDEACKQMEEQVKSDGEPGNTVLKNKYALDIDGNAYSGRYYRLLKSGSAVIKYTMFKEWHDGRLQPWVHFMPLSPGAGELGEMMRFFNHEKEGDGIGRAIANDGKDWTRKTLRNIDLEIVFMRVLIEYDRIIRDDRDRVGFGV